MNNKKTPEHVLTDPPLYDPWMVYTITGTCRCCGVVDAETRSGTHWQGCPVPILESLEYRLSVEVGRHGPFIHGDGKDLQDAAQNLSSQFEDVGYEYRADFSGEADGEPDIYCPARASLTGTVSVSARQIHACIQRAEDGFAETAREMEQARTRVQRTQDRKRLMTTLESRKDRFTEEGYQAARAEILNDPAFADLPPYKAK